MAKRISEKTPEILVTRDYTIFYKSGENRMLKVKRHRKLRNSMAKRGFLPYWPIVVHSNGRKGEGRYVVDDGQHRLALAEYLEQPVYYVISNMEFNIAEINNTQTVWQTVDYAEVYAEKGIQDYKDALEFRKTYGIQITYAFALLAGVGNYSKIEAEFKAGEFKITDRNWAERVASVYCPISTWEKDVRTSRFLEACMACCRVEGFDPQRMVDSAQKHREMLKGYTTRESYLDMMEKVYNYNRRMDNWIPLSMEAQKVIAKTRKANQVQPVETVQEDEQKELFDDLED